MSREYRVVWQRGPHKKYSHHYASLAAAQRKALRVQGRVAESKGLDRDTFICCDGSGYDHECQTWGEWEDATTAEWTPLRMLRIESREVGEWEST